MSDPIKAFEDLINGPSFTEIAEDHRLIKSAKSARDGNVSDAAANDPYVLANRACNECYDPKASTWFDVRDIIARAILAEREASAKIADHEADRVLENEQGYPFDRAHDFLVVARRIAKAIRRR